MMKKTLVLMGVMQSFISLSIGLKPFEFFLLNLNWPPAYCKVPGSCLLSPLPNDFVIHGLWPDTYEGPLQVFCNRKIKYEEIKDSGLLAELNTHWPNLVRGADSNIAQWIYQWRKHGTCSMPFYKQMGYFRMAVDLKTQYPILRHLYSNNIIPSNEIMYSIARIVSVVRLLTGRAARVVCTDYDDKDQQLSELRLCFDRSGEIIDCPGGRWDETCFKPDIYFPQAPAA